LGYIAFRHGDVVSAFKSFNASAHAGSADGMFNLAALYFTGTGAPQSFIHAFLYFTQALNQGHTPAGYALALMHLNGVSCFDI
jgi:TPR repeat protein